MTDAEPVRSFDAALAYLALRLALGMTMLLHGTTRISTGIEVFAAGLLKMFAATPLPPWSVRAFGLGLPFVEATIGVLLLVGLWTRWTLFAGALVMVVLIFGTTLRSDFPGVTTQLTYSVVYFILLVMRTHNRFSLDHLLGRKSK